MAEKAVQFESWAIVECFGHKQLAGKVSEQTIGACSFVRVDIPATTGRPAYTKLLGNGAIYGITPCTEEVARLAAHEIERYSQPIPVHLPKPRALPSGGATSSDEVWPDSRRDEDEDEGDRDSEWRSL